MALALARQGATVCLLGRTQRKLEATYDAIVAAGGLKPALLPFNLETAAAGEYDALHAAVDREFGRDASHLARRVRRLDVTQVGEEADEPRGGLVQVGAAAGARLEFEPAAAVGIGGAITRGDRASRQAIVRAVTEAGGAG